MVVDSPVTEDRKARMKGSCCRHGGLLILASANGSRRTGEAPGARTEALGMPWEQASKENFPPAGTQGTD